MIGLNGFGRVGRGVFRELYTRQGPLVGAIAELNPCVRPAEELTANLAYLLAHDSTYGPFPGQVSAQGQNLVVDGREIPVFYPGEPDKVDWAGAGVRILVDGSGDPVCAGQACGLAGGGVPKVLVTGPVDGADITLVRGVNFDDYDAAKHHRVSCSTCTANALAPVLSRLHNEYGIVSASLTSVHPALSGDGLLDAPCEQFAAGRSGLEVRAVTSEMAHTTARAVPGLAGKLSAMSLRVPTRVVNALLVHAVLSHPPAGLKELEVFLRSLTQGLTGLVRLEEGFCGRPRIAADFAGDRHSAILDLNWLSLDGPLARLLIWHDNEAAYCARVADTIELIARQNP